jgi:HicB-like protein involved in pilus formation
MQIEGFIQAVREDLARVAAVGDDTTIRAAELLAVALEPSLARRLQEALAAAAVELSAQLEDGDVQVRLSGADPELVFVRNEERPAGPADEAFTARITLRLPDSLKSKVESAAARAGVSVNAWLVLTLQDVAEARRAEGWGRNRLTGYGRS